MKVIEVPKYSGNKVAIANDIITRAKKRLTEFCTKRVLALKLAPKTFTFQFDFRDGRRSVAKSIDRLTTLIVRAATKKIPYIDYTAEPFVRSDRDKNMSFILTSPTLIATGFSKENRDEHNLCKEQGYEKHLTRYARLLNRKARANRIPVNISVTSATIIDESWIKTKNSVDSSQWGTKCKDIPYKVLTTVKVQMGFWRFQGNNPSRGITDDSSFNIQEFMKTFQGDVYAENNWVFWSCQNRAGYRTLPQPHLESFLALEKVFFFTDDIISIIKTLSRKTQYAPSAFSIGNPESTG